MANETLSNVNNYIGQKLFAYIGKGSEINDRIKNKFAKSLIFIGDEGQIYNPLTETYIGIGKTAYTHTLTYIAEAHDKVDALNTALTSSLVSGIYANWSEDEWNELLNNNGPGGIGYLFEGDSTNADLKNIADLGKIFATNNIVLKGIGDYDPETHLAHTKEFVNIDDPNLTEDQKKILEYSYVNYPSDTTASRFATSGITVKLEKGINKYLYEIAADIELDESDFTVANGFAGNKIPEEYENRKIWLSDEERGEIEKSASKDIFDKYFEKTDTFVQGTNTLSIDDTLTWSYIANAYSYSLSFAKNYTNNEINRIYSEILGFAEPVLVPVPVTVAKEQVVNGSYTFDAVGELNNPFTFELNKDTIYLRRELIVQETPIEKPATSSDRATVKIFSGDVQAIPYSQYQYLEWKDGKVIWKQDGEGEGVDACGSNRLYFMDRDVVDHNDLAAGPNKDYYNNKYLYTPVENLDEIKDSNVFLYVVNKEAIHNSEINLADGINTFKEVAYILDAITDGLSGDKDENGISLAYNIAYNYRWNEAQDKRLAAIEDGTNVVSSLSTGNNNKYVETRLHSSLVNIVGEDSDYEDGETPYTAYTLGSGATIDLSNEYYVRYLVPGSEDNYAYFQVLDSDLAAYNAALTEYYNDIDPDVEHVSGTTYLDAPVLKEYLKDVISKLGVNANNISEGLYTANLIKTAVSYTGAVSIDVDLTVATTYTTHDYTHNDSTGFVLTPYYDLDYTVDINLTLPERVDSGKFIYDGNDPNKGYTNKTNTSIDDLSGDDKQLLLDAVKNYNILENPKIEDIVKGGKINDITFTYSTEDGGLGIEFVFNINKTQNTDSDKYDGNLYSLVNGTITKAANNITINSSTIDYTKFYLRYAPTSADSVHASIEDGLANTAWVAAFVKDYSSVIIEDIKDREANAFIYANQLIDRLDSTYTASRSQYITGLKQNNGIVTAEAKELPSDNLTSNVVVWGEDGDTILKTFKEKDLFEEVDGKNYFADISHSTPIYIKEEGAYIYQPIATDKNATINAQNNVVLSSGETIQAFKWDIENNEYTREQNQTILNNSIIVGPEANNFVQLYRQRDKYTRIDPTDLVISNGEAKYTLNTVEYTTFYELDTTPANSIKYLSTSSAHHSAENGGEGGNTLNVTAHITKLIDANEANTGLVDAYDVRNTLDNLFEWVDLSEWSEEGENILNKKGADEAKDEPVTD